jgi:hypothetical protein
MDGNEIYYYYHNPDRNPHITIHKGTCGHCNNGKGKHLNAEKGRNSVWTGPFYSLKYAQEYIDKNIIKNYPTSYCRCLSEEYHPTP